MPSPFGTGEIVNRLRRVLDLRGKFGMMVDETLVPVVTTHDATRAPYRLTGRRWSGVAVHAAVVANASYIEIQNTSPFQQVLDRLHIAIGPLALAADIPVAQIGISDPVGAGTPVQVKTSEVRVTGAVPVQVLGLIMFDGNGNPILTGHLFDEVYPFAGFRGTAVAGGIASIFVDNLDLVIPPGTSAYVSTGTPVNPTLNVRLVVAASGFYFDDIPRLGTG